MIRPKVEGFSTSIERYSMTVPHTSVGRTNNPKGKSAWKRRRWRPTAELLEDRLTPSGAGGASLLGAQSASNPNAFVQQAKLTTSTPAASTEFGRSVSLSKDGGMLAVGATGFGPEVGPHSVTVLTRSDRVWTQVAEIYAPDGPYAVGTFGESVALSGDGATLAVGSRSGYSDHDPASLYVYSRSGSEWNLVYTTTFQGGGGFGSNLTISDNGGVIAGGAFNTDVGANVAQGVVHVFVRTDGVYSLSDTIIAPELAPHTLFGGSIDLSGDGATMVVGASGAQVGSTPGAVYVYERTQGDWNLAETLISPGVSFGGPVAISGNGSVLMTKTFVRLGDGPYVAAMRVYEKSGGTWTATADLIAPDGKSIDGFGNSVALEADGSTAVIGASYATVAGVEMQGAAYVFTRSGSTWSFTDKLTAFDGEYRHRFGEITAIGGRTIVVGVPRVVYGSNYRQGAAYVFASPEGFAVTVDPVSQTAQLGTSVMFTAAATGAASVAVQWQVSVDDGATWTDVAGATNSWYSLYPSLAASGNQYRAVFTNEQNDVVVTHPARLTVVKASSAVAIMPSVNPVPVGASFVINVGVTSVHPNARAPLAGWIVLTIGSVYSARREFVVDPTCFQVPSTLPPGTYTVTATFDGAEDPAFGSSSATTTLVITRASSAIEGQVSSTTATAGQTVQLTAVVTATGGVNPPAGRVLFTDNGLPIGFGELAPSGTPGVSVAVFTTAPLTTGGHYYQMVYQGDSQTVASASDVYHVNVAPPAFTATTTTLASSRNPWSAGSAAVTFTATVAAANGTGHPTAGVVDFYIGGVLVATSTVDADGKAVLTTEALVPGVYTLVAKYRGWNQIQPSESAPLFQIVNARVTTKTALTSSLNPSIVGDALTFTATVVDAAGVFRLWTGHVDFYVGEQLVATAPVDMRGQATLTTSALVPGWYTLTARYRGTEDFKPSQSDPLIQTVNQTTTSLTSSRNPSVAGDALIFTATVADAVGPGHPTTGFVDFYSAGVLVGSSVLDVHGKAAITVTGLLDPGSYMVIAVYRGGENILGSVSNILSQTVIARTAPAASTASATPSPSPTARKLPFQARRAILIAARAERLAARTVQRQQWALAHRWR
jgi:Bacterial Ig-like domain (group 3)/FG-GAP repeat